MLHWHYVGYFDPCDPRDKSAKPNKPKVIRPIPEEAVGRCLETFGKDIAEFIGYFPEGYVLCNWSNAPDNLWGRVIRFANALAEAENAVIMNEDFVIEYPPEAKLLQQAKWKK
jgi:hypothetical protein